MKKLTKLEEFLIKWGILEQFKSNFNNSYPYEKFLINYKQNHAAIVSPFIWGNTPEGSDFWNNIHRDWNIFLDTESL